MDWGQNNLISFIIDIQLQIKNKKNFKLILNKLKSFLEKKISRKLCITLIFSLLKSYPNLQQRFSEIIEISTLPPSRSGCLISDPFLNTVIEFGIWPGLLDNFLHQIRKSLIGQLSILDTFVNLENFKNTSGPFWLLWDLYSPISKNNHFLQLIYDGSVQYSSIPSYLKLDITPSEFDENFSIATYSNIINSDLFCPYKNDYHIYERPVGKKKTVLMDY